ncbi:MAG: hypothetical protein IPP15_17780 [Saprospiraceae bacterium]|uniref:Uncharacterized protein n=1 Tax=Candidatus Opimibacter skivensis TaxID=2982028 RepID=A0A9D7XRM4_9BACT|nr:hypothetical protein [Candidatus Opimibacter skivensis]
MKRYLLYSICLLSMLPALSKAQTATEAYRLSTSDPVGTARNLGVGNSMFAIGPDFSAIGSNPAGLGGYRKSEFLITSGFGTSKYSSAFTTDRFNTSTGNYTKFNLPNIGFVVQARPQNSRWNTTNWAIGLNRTADYTRNIHYEGSTLGSITDSWKEHATGVAPDNLNGFEEGLAYTSGAIYDFEKDNIYETDYEQNAQYALQKKETVNYEGGKSELFLAYGADYNQKILIGFSIGFPILNFTQTRNYSETDGPDNGIPFFNSLAYTSSINTTGFGWNAKVGVIVKPTKFINLALAIHSPTRLSLTDNFNTTLTYDYTDDMHTGPIKSESPFGSFEYALRTPWSATGGIGIIAGKSGFVAASAKLTDYSTMKYDYNVRGNGNQYSTIERQVNDDIKTNFGTALQLNMGGEYVLNKFRLRGGVSLDQSAYNNDTSFDPSYHAGVGYREDHFYIDFGYVLTKQDEGYLPYETMQAPQPLVVTEFTNHRISATVGFKF